MGAVGKAKFLAIFLATVLLLQMPSYVMSVDAVEVEDPKSTTDLFNDIIQKIDEFVATGAIDSRTGSSLKWLLNPVKKGVDDNDCKFVIQRLDRFDQRVDRLIKFNALTPEEGQILHSLSAELKAQCLISIGFVPEEILVRFKAGATEAEINQLIADCNTMIISNSNNTLDNLANPLSEETRSLLANFYHLKILRNISEEITKQCFENNPNIVNSAELNIISTTDDHRSDKYPNDPEFLAGNQWSLENHGQVDSRGRIGVIDTDIDVVQAWDLPHRDCSNVVVAILDGGVEQSHRELSTLWINSGEVGTDSNNNNKMTNGKDDDGNGYIDDLHGWDTTDDRQIDLAPGIQKRLKWQDVNGDGPEDTVITGSGHGLHVAGIIGARGDNGFGISGICQNASLMILRVSSGGSSTYANIRDALQYLVIQKESFNVPVRVVNLSMSLFGPTNPTLRDELKALETNDILFVKSAGNGLIIGGIRTGVDIDLPANSRLSYPCNSPERLSNVLCVANSNNIGVLRSTSSFGANSVDLAAPGALIQSLGFNNGFNAIKSGTSMAAPHVSGMAALAFSLFPDKTVIALKNDLTAGSQTSQAASGVDIFSTVKTNAPGNPNSIFGNTIWDGQLRWPYTGDLGDAPPSYDTIAIGTGGALHFDTGNEFFGKDITPELDANTPNQDKDGVGNIDPPKVNQDGADQPIGGEDTGQFTFTPPPPWLQDSTVKVSYQVCSDFFGVSDGAGGRYQGGDADRALYVNAWFDLNNDGAFGLDELLLEDIISPPVSPPPSDKSINPNVKVNLKNVLDNPKPDILGAGNTFPLKTDCEDIDSEFKAPKDDNEKKTFTPSWIRFRLDYGEDKGANDPRTLFAPVGPFPMNEHKGWARHGEVEDFIPEKEEDQFDKSQIEMTVNGPFGSEKVTLTGPSTISVSLGGLSDTDSNGLEQVQTEIIQMELTGFNPILGQVTVRQSATIPSLGQIEETQNLFPGIFEILPFRTGTADGSFILNFEMDIGGQTLHNEEPIPVEAEITKKPANEDETYVQPPTPPPSVDVRLVDEDDQETGISVGATTVRYTPDPKTEVDDLPKSTAEVTLIGPFGTEKVHLAGPTTIEVDLKSLSDPDGNGLEQVQTEIVAMELTGISRNFGPIIIRQSSSMPTLGEIEENANTQTGRIDLQPFAPTGTANSFFNVFVEIEVPSLGVTLHNEEPKRMETTISHKPPAEDETYESPQIIPLLDPGGNPTGISMGTVKHTPDPRIETDQFDASRAELILTGPFGSETVMLEGPTTIEVDLKSLSDPDGNGNEQVQTEIVSMELSGISSNFGPIIVRQSSSIQTLGEIEENANSVPNVLELPPFGTGTATSFFDVFVDIEVPSLGVTLHNEEPKRMETTITNKPPAKGETYQSPETIPLLDPGGNPTGIAMGTSSHTPDPEDRDELEFFLSSGVESDLAGHFPFIGPLPDSVIGSFSGDNISFRGDPPWVEVRGPLNPDGSFGLDGRGVVAGFPDIAVVMQGQFDPDGSFVFDYTMGAEGGLPSAFPPPAPGTPIVYSGFGFPASPPPPVIPGDINGDGVVDQADLDLVVGKFGRTSSDVGFDETCDLNSDGVINILDISLVGSLFGSLPPPADLGSISVDGPPSGDVDDPFFIDLTGNNGGSGDALSTSVVISGTRDFMVDSAELNGVGVPCNETQPHRQFVCGSRDLAPGGFTGRFGVTPHEQGLTDFTVELLGPFDNNPGDNSGGFQIDVLAPGVPLVSIDVLTIGGVDYPKKQFKVVTGTECLEPDIIGVVVIHPHIADDNPNSDVFPIDLGPGISDPDQLGCGFGKFPPVVERTLFVTQEQIDFFLGTTGIQLP